MRILVTGRHGQLALSLLTRCWADGIELVATGRPELDLERPQTIAAAVARVRPDVVINGAAYTAVDQAEDDAERAFRVNGAAAGEIAAAARDVGARIIHLSTDYVFDGTSNAPYREDAGTNPLGVYGQSKLAGEAAVRAATPDHVIVRTAWVYSPFGKNFLRTMTALAQSRDVVSVVADQWGNPSSALDLADGLGALVDDWAAGGSAGLGEVVHLTGSGEASWFDFAEAIFAQCTELGLPSARVEPLTTAQYATRARRPANSRLDCAKFEALFKYRAPDWRKSMAEVVRRLAAAHG